MISNRRHLQAIMDERDHRYEREGELRAEALRIKQEADEQARSLARADQAFKDEQANRLREQISQERSEAREREAKFITVEDYDRRHDELVREVGRIATLQAEGGGKESGRLDARAVVLAASSIGVAFLGILAAVLAAAHVFG